MTPISHTSVQGVWAVEHSSQDSTENLNAPSDPEGSAPLDYPLGLRRAWCTVFGSYLIVFCSTGVLQCFGVFQDFYTTRWMSRYSASTISWIGSVQVFLELTIGALAGGLYDAGYCKIMLRGGSILFVFCFFMVSLVRPDGYYQAFLSQGIGMGIAIGFLFLPSCTLISHHFKTQKARAMGIILSSGPLGAVIFSILLNNLLYSSAGFDWGVRAAAIISAGCLLLGNLMISVPPITKPSSTSSQSSDTGMRDLPYLLTVVTGFLLLLETYFPVYYIQLFATTHNMSEKLTFYSVAIYNLSSMFARIISNYYADRVGAIDLFIVCCIVNGFVIYGMLGCGHVVGLVLFAIFHGFFFGSTLSLFLPVVVSLAPSHAHMGKIMGFSWGPAGIAALIGPPIAGALVGKSLTWWKGVTFAAICSFLAAAVQIVARQIHLRRLREAKAKTTSASC